MRKSSSSRSPWPRSAGRPIPRWSRRSPNRGSSSRASVLGSPLSFCFVVSVHRRKPVSVASNPSFAMGYHPSATRGQRPVRAAILNERPEHVLHDAAMPVIVRLTRSVDPDDGAHAEQQDAPGGTAAGRARAVFLAAEDDQRGPVGDVLAGGVVEGHLLAVL